mgnify:CR=1 FL=1
MNRHIQGKGSRRAPRCVLWALLIGAAAHPEVTSGATHLVPEEYATIQAAIDAAAVGDTVLIGPGTYRGEGNREIELRGRDIVVTSRTGPEDTIIDCEYAGRGFFIHERETRAARVVGLTITHGATAPGDPGGSLGAGIACSLSSPTISDCCIYECYSFSDGGGLGFVVFEGVVERCLIAGCYAERGGGVWVQVGESEIRDCVITGNFAQDGGGICFGGTGPNRLFGSTVAANFAVFGGGILAANPLLLDKCVVWDNCTFGGDGDEIWCGRSEIRCSDIDRTGVYSGYPVGYDEYCIFTNPLFCRGVSCGQTTDGDWQLDAASPCLPQHSPCGELIGALGQGCGGTAPTGACCFPDGSCRVLEQAACGDEHGSYMGDDTICDPNPCHTNPTETTTWGRLKEAYRSSRL